MATAVKLARGTFRPDRDGIRFDVVPVNGVPVRPTDLGEAGGLLWDQIIAEHSDRKTLGTVDSSALATLCRTWELLQAAHKAAKVAPCDKEIRCAYLGYLAACDKLGSKFGWTASDRANMKLGAGEKKPTVPTRARTILKELAATPYLIETAGAKA